MLNTAFWRGAGVLPLISRRSYVPSLRQLIFAGQYRPRIPTTPGPLSQEIQLI
ncbi:hypothetical protein KCP77_12900 [Salmonella enterica subsp. enterica]|nr:hypothetical protein KCP77_12900 [Salmonella enterica subsp. enterica]